MCPLQDHEHTVVETGASGRNPLQCVRAVPEAAQQAKAAEADPESLAAQEEVEDPEGGRPLLLQLRDEGHPDLEEEP